MKPLSHALAGLLAGSTAIASLAQMPAGLLPPVGPTSTRSVAANAHITYDVRNGYTLAFVDADIRRVADAVLGSMLGVDYSVDPAVTGNVTLRTAKPVTRESLLPLLENALRSVNAAIVVSGSSYRVVPRADARLAGALASGGGDAAPVAGYATEIVTLKNASAKEMARLIEQFLGKDSVAGTDPARNQILISGSQSEREAARAMIARFDVDALAGMNFQTYRLENVDPDTMLDELQSIFQPPFDIIGTRVRLVPLPRLRSIIAIGADPADFARIDPWIRRLDAGSGGKPKLYSYSVQNGRARDLANALQRVFGGGGSSDDSEGQGNRSSSSLGASGGAGLGSISGASIGGSSAKGAGESGQTVASQASQSGRGSSGSDYGSYGGGKGPRIVPSDENNSLLIYATGEQYELVREVLEKIDRPVAQVLIEATLAEVTLTKGFELGVDWAFLNGKSTFDLRNAATAAPAALFPGFSYAFAGSNAKVVLNTLQSKTDVKVLSAPRLIVLNNQTATLQVGDQVPIVTQQAQSVSSAGAPVVNNIELHDTGVILKVTPRVNESGTVTLDIAQEVSDVAETTTSGINSPTIQQRRLATTVSTRSGQMIALGGLIRERATIQKSGIPLLSQIPVLGAAFGNQNRTATRTELVILITPTVIRTPDDVRAVVDDVISGLDRTRPLIDRAKARQAGAPIPPKR
jgi:general secretion pathway protein D